jgi:hypothetical protein
MDLLEQLTIPNLNKDARFKLVLNISVAEESDTILNLSDLNLSIKINNMKSNIYYPYIIHSPELLKTDIVQDEYIAICPYGFIERMDKYMLSEFYNINIYFACLRIAVSCNQIYLLEHMINTYSASYGFTVSDIYNHLSIYFGLYSDPLIIGHLLFLDKYYVLIGSIINSNMPMFKYILKHDNIKMSKELLLELIIRNMSLFVYYIIYNNIQLDDLIMQIIKLDLKLKHIDSYIYLIFSRGFKPSNDLLESIMKSMNNDFIKKILPYIEVSRLNPCSVFTYSNIHLLKYLECTHIFKYDRYIESKYVSNMTVSMLSYLMYKKYTFEDIKDILNLDIPELTRLSVSYRIFSINYVIAHAFKHKLMKTLSSYYKYIYITFPTMLIKHNEEYPDSIIEQEYQCVNTDPIEEKTNIIREPVKLIEMQYYEIDLEPLDILL